MLYESRDRDPSRQTSGTTSRGISEGDFCTIEFVLGEVQKRESLEDGVYSGCFPLVIRIDIKSWLFTLESTIRAFIHINCLLFINLYLLLKERLL